MKKIHFVKRSIMTAGIIVLIIVVQLGCLSSRTRVRDIEPQANVLKGDTYKILGEAEGQSSSFNIFWLIPVTPRVKYQDAVDEAVSKLGGDDLINVRSWMKREYWIVGTVNVLQVKGTVILYNRQEP